MLKQSLDEFTYLSEIGGLRLFIVVFARNHLGFLVAHVARMIMVSDIRNNPYFFFLARKDKRCDFPLIASAMHKHLGKLEYRKICKIS